VLLWRHYTVIAEKYEAKWKGREDTAVGGEGWAGRE